MTYINRLAMKYVRILHLVSWIWACSCERPPAGDVPGLSYKEMGDLLTSHTTLQQTMHKHIGELDPQSQTAVDKADSYAALIKELEEGLAEQKKSLEAERGDSKNYENKQMTDVHATLGGSSTGGAETSTGGAGTSTGGAGTSTGGADTSTGGAGTSTGGSGDAVILSPSHEHSDMTQEESDSATTGGLTAKTGAAAQSDIAEIDAIVKAEIEKSGKAHDPNDKTFDPQRFRISLSWTTQVDLDLWLDTPGHRENDVVHWGNMHVDGFELDLDDRAEEDKTHVESISFGGDVMPDGQYKAVAKYYSGVQQAVTLTAILNSPDESQDRSISGTVQQMGDAKELFTFTVTGGKITGE